MKQAKRRPLPLMVKLAKSIKRTDRSLTEALAFCAASNKRISKNKMRTTVEAANAKRAFQEATQQAATDAVAAGCVVAGCENGKLVEYGPGLKGLASRSEKPVSIAAMNATIAAAGAKVAR